MSAGVRSAPPEGTRPAEAAGDQGAALELPPRVDLPLFAYALLKPGEPAYRDGLEALVTQARPATLPTGVLRHRDGLPVLDVDSQGSVEGVVLHFAPGSEQQAYATVSAFASRQQHRWLATDVVLDGGLTLPVNLLRGRHPRRGSSTDVYPDWTAVTEPVFGPGLGRAREVALAEATEPFPLADDGGGAAWRLLYRLHAAYLLLWSVLERFALLAFGPGASPSARLSRLDHDPCFLGSVLAAGVRPVAKLADNADPYKRVREDGRGAVYCWNSLRTNVGHHGRSPAYDGTLVRRALVELHDTLRVHLADRLPALTARWQRDEPDGAAHGWLLRPVVAAEGLA